MAGKHTKKLKKLISEFEKNIQDECWGKAHGCWEKIMKLRVEELDPELTARLRRIAKSSPFWFLAWLTR